MSGEALPRELSDFERKGQIIESILDDMMPIPEDASPDDADTLDLERSALVLSSGWNQMTTTELERIYLEAGNESLPY